MKIWKNEEVKNLFCEVEKCKNENISLKQAFILHSKKYSRKPNSVRNYYYHEIDNLKNDEKRCKKLDIDLKKHEKIHFVVFEKQKEESLCQEIENLTKQGYSVRSACKKLSGGDLTLMTRYQNKFQNLKKKEVKENANNIIPFKKQQTLSEADINSLFMGLVKLIKKTTIDDYIDKHKTEKENAHRLLKKAFADLNQKDKQIEKLIQDFNALKTENKVLAERLQFNAESKQEALKYHIEKKKLSKFYENKID